MNITGITVIKDVLNITGIALVKDIASIAVINRDNLLAWGEFGGEGLVVAEPPGPVSPTCLTTFSNFPTTRHSHS